MREMKAESKMGAITISFDSVSKGLDPEDSHHEMRLVVRKRAWIPQTNPSPSLCQQKMSISSSVASRANIIITVIMIHICMKERILLSLSHLYTQSPVTGMGSG